MLEQPITQRLPDKTDEEHEFDVSVVLAIYNEAGHIRTEIERIRRALDSSQYSYEIIAVDDGSTDGSFDELREIDEIRIIRFAQNRGSGSARKAGTHTAKGRVVVWTDVDMTYPNEEIPRLVKELEGYDQVVGARTSEEGTLKFARVPAKWILRKLAEFLTETKIPDLNSGLRAFRREVAHQFLHLLPPGFSCVTTMTMSFLSNGYSVRHIPIDYSPRSGRSKFHWWTDTKRFGIQIIRMILSFNPLRFFLPVALALTALAAGKLIFDWIGKDFRLATNTLLIFFAAFQILAIGLLADLVVRVAKPRDGVDPESIRGT